MGFPCGSASKESACNEGDLGLIPGLGRFSEEGKGYPLQYAGLENSMDCILHGSAKSQTQLSDFHFHFQVYTYLNDKEYIITFKFNLFFFKGNVSTECPPDSRLCADALKCIAIDLFCDGELNCPDGSDEDNQTCGK